MEQRKFKVSIFHGKNNHIHTKDVMTSRTAFDAAHGFMTIHFPNEVIYGSLKWEQPKDGKRIWSVKTSASGLSLWVKEAS